MGGREVIICPAMAVISPHQQISDLAASAILMEVETCPNRNEP
jgi:hypothetical protein